jgi:hypothetical protein
MNTNRYDAEMGTTNVEERERLAMTRINANDFFVPGTFFASIRVIRGQICFLFYLCLFVFIRD